MRQVRTLIEIARVAHALQRAADLPTPDAVDLLQKVRGVGPWTANMALGARLGRPDAIPVGDFHMPHTIAWALAGEPRGTDARMLELLAPFPGQAFRVVRLVSAARIEAPEVRPPLPTTTTVGAASPTCPAVPWRRWTARPLPAPNAAGVDVDEVGGG